MGLFEKHVGECERERERKGKREVCEVGVRDGEVR